MVVEVLMEEDFDGVIYTRGSFMSKPKDCYYDAEGGTDHKLKIPFDKCGLKEDFDGVIYTRGSFMSKPKDCYYDAEGGTDHKLKIPFDKCGLKEDEEGFISQVIVVQHDDWLIFPGDLAFSLHCRPRGEAGASAVARIGLSDPDPSSAGKSLPKHKRSVVESDQGTVVFTQEDI